MHHCMYCFHVSRHGLPLCTTCGHSAPERRVCRLAHVSPATAHRCLVCHTTELSTPAPPGSWLNRMIYRLTHTMLVLLAGAALLLVALLTTGDVDRTRGIAHLIAVGATLLILYRTSLVFPGPLMRRSFPPFTKERGRD